MDTSEEILILKSHLAQLEEKLTRQRRELDALKKQMAQLQEVVSELERQLE
jgi:phage shock protein A